MTTYELRQRLLNLNTTGIKLLAARAGVGERNLWKIRAGLTVSASEQTRDKLGRALRGLPARAKVLA